MHKFHQREIVILGRAFARLTSVLGSNGGMVKSGFGFCYETHTHTHTQDFPKLYSVLQQTELMYFCRQHFMKTISFRKPET